MTDEKTTTYTATLEITPEMEKYARAWARADFDPFAALAHAILAAKPQPPEPTLIEQAYKVVFPNPRLSAWSMGYTGDLQAIGAMSVWIAEHHNGRSHGYRLRPDGKWESWFESRGVSFDTQQEAMASLVVEMHREDTDA